MSKTSKATQARIDGLKKARRILAQKRAAEKKKHKGNGVAAAYGREVLLQVPIGKHETRTMTIKQASIMYRHLRTMHWMLK